MAINLDLGQIYGLGNCPMGGCDMNGMQGSGMPSLEELASYNTAPTRGAMTGSAGQMQGMPQNQMGAAPQTQSGNQQNQGPQPALNGVSNAMQVPMTQEQINAEDSAALQQIENYNQPFPVTAESIQYLNSLMRTQIGRRVSVQFLIGSGGMVERSGYLLAVGANFILLNEIGTRSVLSCDFYSIKFVTFYY